MEHSSQSTDKINPYGYLKSGEFTSELFKVEIHHLHAKVGFKQLTKRLISIGLKPHKVKIFSSVTFVTFKSAEDRDDAIQKINGHIWKGNVLTASVTEARADPFLKRKLEDNHDDLNAKMPMLEDDVPEDEKLKDHVVKYWRFPYDLQLQKKEAHILTILDKIKKRIMKDNHMLSNRKFIILKSDSQLLDNGNNNDRFILRTHKLLASPVVDNYRNKCEFTIGWTLTGEGPVVGFCHGKYRSGSNAVGDARTLPIIHSTMIRVLHHMNKIVVHLVSSDFQPQLSVVEPGKQEGHLRGVTIRMGSKNVDVDGNICNNGSLLLLVDINPRGLSEDNIIAVSEYFRLYFTEGEGKECEVSSIMVSLRRNNGDPLNASVTRQVFGAPYVYEQIMKKNFRVSFNAFFQVNTAATEVLYGIIRQHFTEIVAQSSKKVTVIDVCCGTGTIGLCLADLATQVVGIEMCQESIEDAKYNASLNDIQNVSFHVGKAEDALDELLITEERASNNTDREFVAVVDPPRAGLHTSVVLAIRRCRLIKKIIFVSCNPDAVVGNLVDFSRPISKRVTGHPFIPKAAIPVDLFPHTDHVELVLVLERHEI